MASTTGPSAQSQVRESPPGVYAPLTTQSEPSVIALIYPPAGHISLIKIITSLSNLKRIELNMGIAR